MSPLTPLPQPAHPNPYTIQGRKLLYDCPWIRVREDRFTHRSGGEGRYAVCGFKHTACGVLALDEQDRVVLVGQWRYPLEVYSWEIPEGGGEEHESPFECIRRELAEEAGVEARCWEPLAFYHPSNSSTDEETFIFLATELHALPQGHAPEDVEELLSHREPFIQCLARVLSGEITDGLSMVAILALQAQRTGMNAALPAGLAERFFQRPSEHPSPGRARWGNLDSV
jgi:8-oxo-dGTP pyrophosphatase MutT (NUDIX family)